MAQPIEVSRSGGSVTKDVAICFASINQSGGDYLVVAPTVSCDLPGVTISAVAVNVTTIRVGTRLFPPGTAVTFTITVDRKAKLGDGILILRYTSVLGNERAHYYPVNVKEYLP